MRDERPCSVHAYFPIPKLQPITTPNLIKIRQFFSYLGQNLLIKSGQISTKFSGFLVWSVMIPNTKFHQNRTIFGPYFGSQWVSLCGPNLKLGKITYFCISFHHAKTVFESVITLIVFILLAASEFEVAATPKPAIRGQKYFGWLTYSMLGLIDISFKKIGDFEFGWLFVT